MNVLHITYICLRDARAMSPDKPTVTRPHTMDEGGVTFFMPQISERRHVPWTSIVYMETKA